MLENEDGNTLDELAHLLTKIPLEHVILSLGTI